MNDLKKIALHEGVSVLKSKEPFGGYYCTLIDLDGNRVDIVYGQHELVPIEERKRWFPSKILV